MGARASFVLRRHRLGGGGGFRNVQILRNGNQIANDTVTGADGLGQVVTTITRMTAGQYVEVQLRQNSGGDVGTALCSGNACPSLAMAWIGP